MAVDDNYDGGLRAYLPEVLQALLLEEVKWVGALEPHSVCQATSRR